MYVYILISNGLNIVVDAEEKPSLILPTNQSCLSCCKSKVVRKDGTSKKWIYPTNP